jgi:hypothetical protein
MVRDTNKETRIDGKRNIRDSIKHYQKGVTYIPPEIIPPGMVYGWIENAVLNQPTQSMERAVRMGWTPVPSSRHNLHVDAPAITVPYAL